MQRSSNSKFGTNESPNYGLLSQDMVLSLGTATGLFALTVGAMILFADTIIGSAVLALYNFLPIAGVIVVGIGLTIGRELGMDGFMSGDTTTGAIGTVITVLTYGAFGGAVLTPYDVSTYASSIVVAAGITVGISLIAGTWVMKSDRSFDGWDKKSVIPFIGGIASVLIASFLPGAIGGLFGIIGFALFVIGFVIDLVYEIWAMTSGRRNPSTNGFGIYIAFTGIFVHILQMVLSSD